MKKKYVVSYDIKKGVCSRCKYVDKAGFHSHTVKVQNIETKKEEWLCNKHVRRYDTKMARKLTKMDLEIIKQKIQL